MYFTLINLWITIAVVVTGIVLISFRVKVLVLFPWILYQARSPVGLSTESFLKLKHWNQRDVHDKYQLI